MSRAAWLIGIVLCAFVAAHCGATAPSCTYALTPNAASFPPAGGTVSLSVATSDSCAWTVSASGSWFAVVVTAPSRMGSGVVQIVTGPNTGALRTGSVTVAGQTVTVSQAGLVTATLSGRVKDAWIDSGLAGVTVAVVSGPSAASTTTAADGGYALGNLVPGTYRISYSKPFYTSNVQTVEIAADTTLSMGLNAAITFPLTTADLSGAWAAGGPYPNEPMRLTLLQHGSSLTGYYIDRHDYSESVTGSQSGQALLLRIPVAGTIVTFEGTVDDERHVHGLLKDDRFGGNFPVSMVR